MRSADLHPATSTQLLIGCVAGPRVVSAKVALQQGVGYLAGPLLSLLLLQLFPGADLECISLQLTSTVRLRTDSLHSAGHTEGSNGPAGPVLQLLRGLTAAALAVRGALSGALAFTLWCFCR